MLLRSSGSHLRRLPFVRFQWRADKQSEILSGLKQMLHKHLKSLSLTLPMQESKEEVYRS